MGLVLVFDLDETLIGTKKKYENGKYYISDIQLNEKLFQIIFHAKQDGPVAVDAILLLTNNTNVPSEYRGLRMGFLDIIDLVVTQKYGVGFDEIFDNIYTGQSEEVKSGKRTKELVEFRGFGDAIYEASNRNKKNPKAERLVKDIATVAKILREKGHSTENLKDRIIFFDDEPREHVLKRELEGHGGKYITIDPPFGKGEDKTDLSPLYDALGMDMFHQAKGGARRRRTARKKKQLRRTKKYRVKKASS
jgi:hypothetical protein